MVGEERQLKLLRQRLRRQSQRRAVGGDGRAWRIDFASGELRHRRLKGANRSSLLARAVGAKTAREAPFVIDATAGLGRDAFVLALLGCRVLMLERSLVLWALLRDALARAARDPELAEAAARMQLVRDDAIHYFRERAPAGRADVIYLDPMFPAEKRSALVKLELRMLRRLVGGDDDADRLFEAAAAARPRRLVVKRMKSAPRLGTQPPSFVISGKTNRFDGYLW